MHNGTPPSLKKKPFRDISTSTPYNKSRSLQSPLNEESDEDNNENLMAACRAYKLQANHYKKEANIWKMKYKELEARLGNDGDQINNNKGNDF